MNGGGWWKQVPYDSAICDLQATETRTMSATSLIDATEDVLHDLIWKDVDLVHRCGGRRHQNAICAVGDTVRVTMLQRF